MEAFTIQAFDIMPFIKFPLCAYYRLPQFNQAVVLNDTSHTLPAYPTATMYDPKLTYLHVVESNKQFMQLNMVNTTTSVLFI